MEVRLSSPSARDALEFIESVRGSRSLRNPWVDPSDSPDRFARYLESMSRQDHAAIPFRHVPCWGLIGYASISNIVLGAFHSAYLGYAGFPSHLRRGLMSEAIVGVISCAFRDLKLH